MSEFLTVIKLGGALLTDKQRPYTLRQSVLDQVASEIKAALDAGLIERLILVHGVGSFGHPPVVQHQLHKGLKSAEQLIHLTDTQNKVIQIRLAIAEAFHDAGVAACTILPSSCMTASGFALESSYLDALAGFLDIGMAPLLGGDVLADRQVGFCVYGGDHIAVDLALHFQASRLIFATEVDGIYDKDPQKYADAQPIHEFSLSSIGGGDALLDDHRKVDASGAMAGKLAAVQPAREAIFAGLSVHILSMIKEGNLTDLLSGKEETGTLVVP
ncbi:MAG: isopentenyl phosphate kinase [Candidatus Promineifilaceae bacterium]|jgi:isopentenyl phosphate kinase